MANFCVLYFSEPRPHISYLHSKYDKGHIMCGSMVDIQSAAAENSRGRKEETTAAE